MSQGWTELTFPRGCLLFVTQNIGYNHFALKEFLGVGGTPSYDQSWHQKQEPPSHGPLPRKARAPGPDSSAHKCSLNTSRVPCTAQSNKAAQAPQKPHVPPHPPERAGAEKCRCPEQELPTCRPWPQPPNGGEPRGLRGTHSPAAVPSRSKAIVCFAGACVPTSTPPQPVS